MCVHLGESLLRDARRLLREDAQVIRVTVEIVPLGIEAHKRVLGTMTIINDGTGDTYNGNYDVRKRSGAGTLRNETKVIGRVEGFKRRSHTVWQLLALALEAIHVQS